MLTEEIVTLRGCDEVKVECPVSVCAPSEFLQVQIDEVENQDGTEIVVPKVAGATLEHIVTFLKHYAEEPLAKIEHPIEGNTVEEVRIGGNPASRARGNCTDRNRISSRTTYSLHRS